MSSKESHPDHKPTKADLPFATVDLDRARRCGRPEVIFGQGKTAEQINSISNALLEAGQAVLITRTSQDVYDFIKQKHPYAKYHGDALCITMSLDDTESNIPSNPRTICICVAGTSDLPVAEEAAVTAEFYGNKVERVYDVGVAGIHRLLAKQDILDKADVIIAVAGMEGALPSVIAGLVAVPVIAVPTSIGYGANFQGLAALLGMLNACGSGITVVNIDNGFGAGYAASQITQLLIKNTSQD
ncbi:MAG: nickel pincer cofactor biosynthesis protein LarB [Verrucomicrobiota bacterium]